MNYGKGIRIVRAARGLSQKDLAKQSDLNGNYISLIESGHRVPSTEALISISKALNVPLYLIALLGSDADDLRNIGTEQAGILGRQLLDILLSAEAEDNKKADSSKNE